MKTSAMPMPAHRAHKPVSTLLHLAFATLLTLTLATALHAQQQLITSDTTVTAINAAGAPQQRFNNTNADYVVDDGATLTFRNLATWTAGAQGTIWYASGAASSTFSVVQGNNGGGTIVFDGGATKDTLSLGGANSQGGAFFLRRDSAYFDTLKLIGGATPAMTGTITGFWATSAGGVLYANTGKGNVFISNFNISSNGVYSNNDAAAAAVTKQGGAFSLENAGSFSQSAFLDNVIFAKNSVIVTSMFAGTSNNTARGGAMFFGATSGTLTFNKVEFRENSALSYATSTARAYGGAIFLDNNVGNITGTNVIFASNTAAAWGGIMASSANSAYGGAIYMNSTASANFMGVFFGGNDAYSANDSYGGAIYAQTNANLIVTNGTFSNNKADGKTSYGGALCWRYASGTLNNVLFESNTAGVLGAVTAYGGAIYAQTSVTLIFTNGTFSNNTADGSTSYGGAYYLRDATGTMNNVLFESNKAGVRGVGTAYGGAIHIGSSASLVINIGTFKGNSVGAADNSSLGGAIYMSTVATGTLNNVNFISNTAGGGGGAIFLTNSCALTVNGGTFSGNTVTGGATATNGGGAIYAITSLVNLTDVVFLSNTVNTSGAVGGSNPNRAGAIYLNSGTLNYTVKTDITNIGNTAISPGIGEDPAKGGFLFFGGNYGVANFDIATGKTLTIGSAADVNSDGIGSGNNQSLMNINRAAGYTGAMVLHANSTANTGSTNIYAGSFLLGNAQAVFGGAGINIGMDTRTARAGGWGTLGTAGSGNYVAVNASGILQVGLNNTGPQNLTIASDLTLANASTIDFLDDTNLLTVSGNLTQSNTFTINFDALSIAAGKVNLINVLGSNGILGINTANITVTLNNTTLVAGVDYNRLGLDAIGKYLWIRFGEVPPNHVLTWTGDATNAWLTGSSWKTTVGNTPIAFADGDIVNLDSTNPAASNTINLTAGAIVLGMNLAGSGSYAITGAGAIVIDAAYDSTLTESGPIAAATGKLTLGAIATDTNTLTPTAFNGVLDLTGQLGAANRFTAGIDLNGGALRISSTGQLGTTLSQVTFGGDTANSGTLLAAANITFNGASGTTQRLTLAAGAAGSLAAETGKTLTLTNNTSTADGGAIANAGDLTLANIALTNNRSTTGNGGAIYNSGTLAATNALFTSNTTLAAPGGAIANTGLLAITSATFNRNYSASNGGAINNDPAGDLTLANVLFTSNTAGNGGAISNAGVATLTDATFTNNTASTGNGGAIHNTGTLNLNATTGGASAGNTAGATAAAGGFLYQAANAVANIDVSSTFALSIGSAGAANATADTIASADATAVINKLNTGALVLHADSGASYTGTTNINAGSLLLGNSAAKLGGEIVVNPTGVLGGIGAAANNVTVTNGGAVMAGLAHANATIATSETFTIAGTLTLNTGATLLYDIHGGATSDHLAVGALAYAGLYSATVTLNSAASGTYNILTNAAGPLATTATEFATAITGGEFSVRTAIAYHLGSDFGATNNDLYLTLASSNTNLTWTGSTASFTWNGGLKNWVISPANTLADSFIDGDTVTFDDPNAISPAAHTVAVAAAGVRASGMTVNTTGTYTFTGGAITTSTAGTNLAAPTGALAITGPGLVILANETANNFQNGINIATGTLQGNAATLNTPIIANAGALVFDQATGGNFTGTITGAGSLAKLNNGNLTLSGSTAYTGATTVTGGTLTLGNANQIAASSAVTLAAGATLDATSGAQTLKQLSGTGNITTGAGLITLSNSAAPTIYAGVISGAAPVTKLGANTLTLAADNTFAGTLTISEGTVQLGAGSAPGSVAGGIANNATLVLNHGASNATLASAITGNGLITKLATDTGTLTLTGNSAAFSGTTDIRAGALVLGAATAALGGQTNLQAGASFAGSGTLGNLTAYGGNTITVGLTHRDLLVTTPKNLTLTGTLNLAANTTLLFDLFGTGSIGANDQIIAAGLIRATSPASAIDIGVNTSLSGTYTLITTTALMSTSNTAGFNTTVNGGAFSIRSAARYIADGNNLNLVIVTTNFPGLVWDGTPGAIWQDNIANWRNSDGKFLNGDSVIFDDTRAGTSQVAIAAGGVQAVDMTVSTAGTYTFTGGAITTSTNINSTILAGATGKLTLTSLNTGLVVLNNAAGNFEGGIDILSGTLQGNAATLATGAAAGILNNAALVFSQTGAATYANAITGTGSLVKQNTGTLALSNAANTYTGGINVAQGVLSLTAPGAASTGNINIAANSALLISNAATYTVAKPLTGAGTLGINLTGTGAVNLPGAATSGFAGTVNLGTSALALSGQNATALANATLATGTGNVTTVGTAGGGAQQIAGLAINGGKLVFSTTIPADTQAASYIKTGTLTLGTSGTIQVTIPATAAEFSSTGASLFAQATGTGAIDRLVRADTVVNPNNAANLALIDQNGANATASAKTANITQNGSNVATGTYTYKLNATGGLNVNYGLASLTLNTGATLQLTPAAGEGFFSATISGTGNLAIDATLAPVTLATANNFTGAIALSAGTLNAGANNSLGAPANTLTAAAGTTLNLAGKTQTLAGITAANNNTLTLAGGTLTLTGALTQGDNSTLATGTNGKLAAASIDTGAGTRITEAAGAAITTGALNLGANSVIDLATGTLATTAANALATAASSTINLNNGALSTAGGSIAGAITGTGALNITAGNLAITSANAGFTAPATIRTGGTATLGNLQALGAAPISITGTGVLNLDNTDSGTLANALSGGGSLNFNGAGTTTISRANTITGNTTVADTATLILADAAALGNTGTATVAGNLTLRPPASQTFSLSVDGPGVLNLDAAGLLLTGNNTIDTINVLAGASVTAGSANALASANLALADAIVIIAANDTRLGAVRMKGASALTLAANNAQLGAVTLADSSTLGFAPSNPAGTARADSLAATGNAVTLAFNASISGATSSNLLTVTGAITGTYNVAINNTGSVGPRNDRISLKLIDGDTAAATFLGSGTFDIGGMHIFSYDFSKNDGLQLNAVRNELLLSVIGASVLANATSAMPLSWFTELDTVEKRLGDLQLDTREKPGGDLWLRAYAQRYKVNDRNLNLPFDEDQFGTEVGIDYGGRHPGYSVYTGIFLGYGRTSRVLRDMNASGHTDGVGAGVYMAYADENGWYVNGVAKYNHFANRFTGATDTYAINGRYNNTALGASIEAGKRFVLKNNWHLIPNAQVALASISSASYTTDNGMEVRVDPTLTEQVRAGAILAYRQELPSRQVFQPYIKVYAARQWARNSGVVVDGEVCNAPLIAGARLDAGAGINWKLSTGVQVWFDYECAWARNYKKPYGLTAGISYAW